MIVLKIDDFYVSKRIVDNGQEYEQFSLKKRNIIRPVEVMSIDTFYPDLTSKGTICKRRCILVDAKLGVIKVFHTFEELEEMKTKQYDRTEIKGFLKYASGDRKTN